MVGHLFEFEQAQKRPGGFGQRRLVPAHPRQAQRVADEIAAAVRMPADADIVEHRLRREQRQVLKGAADADLGDPVRRAVDDRAPLEQDVAAIGRVETADAVEQRGLAGAVRADQAEDLSRLDREGDAVKGDDAAEAKGDVAHFEQRRPGGRRCRRGRRSYARTRHDAPPMRGTKNPAPWRCIRASSRKKPFVSPQGRRRTCRRRFAESRRHREPL